MGLIRKTRIRQAYTRIGCILDLALPNQSVETDAPNSGAPLTSGREAVGLRESAECPTSVNEVVAMCGGLSCDAQETEPVTERR